MFDISGGLFKVERGERVADGEALIEGLVGGEAEFSGEVRLADEDESEERSGVEVVVEEEAELVEEFGREEMSFVNNEEGEAIFAGQVLQGVA
jgi:hypothetical protein